MLSPSRPPSQVTVCLILLGVLGFAMSAQYAIGMAPLLKADEKQHAAYAIVLSQGVLPTIDTNTPADPVRYPQFAEALFGLDEPRRDIWVANHPPLFYVMSLPLVWLGDAVGGAAGVNVTLLGMRLLNALGYALSIILIGLPGTAAWALGLLVGINMLFGGSALIAMALHARTPDTTTPQAPKAA